MARIMKRKYAFTFVGAWVSCLLTCFVMVFVFSGDSGADPVVKSEAPVARIKKKDIRGSAINPQK